MKTSIWTLFVFFVYCIAPPVPSYNNDDKYGHKRIEHRHNQHLEGKKGHKGGHEHSHDIHKKDNLKKVDSKAKVVNRRTERIVNHKTVTNKNTVTKKVQKTMTKKKQATVLIVREIREGYYAPLGVWQVRENVRNAMDSHPEKYQSFDEALKSIDDAMVTKDAWRERSKLIPLLRSRDIMRKYMLT